MKIGVCTDAANAGIVKKLGYDYIELAITELAPEKPESEFAPLRAQVLHAGLQAEVCNKFFPKGLMLVGPDADVARTRRYIEVGLARASELGCRVVVFGSPHARQIPDGFLREKAFQQLITMARVMGEVAEERGQTIVLEPLDTKLTNTIWTVEEAVQLAEEIKHKHVQVLADIYMMHVNKEPLNHMALAGKHLVHVHASDPDRKAPGNPQYLTFHQEASAILKGMGYKGRVSVEARFTDFEAEARSALAVMRQLYS